MFECMQKGFDTFEVYVSFLFVKLQSADVCTMHFWHGVSLNNLFFQTNSYFP